MLGFNVISTLFVISAADHVGTGNNLLQGRSLKKKSILNSTNIGIAAAGVTALSVVVVFPILCSTRVIDKTVKNSAESGFVVNYLVCPFNAYTCATAAECEESGKYGDKPTCDGTKAGHCSDDSSKDEDTCKDTKWVLEVTEDGSTPVPAHCSDGSTKDEVMCNATKWVPAEHGYCAAAASSSPQQQPQQQAQPDQQTQQPQQPPAEEN